MKKDHRNIRQQSLLKQFFKLLPPSLPKKIYRLMASLPLIRPLVNSIIRLQIPTSIKIDEGDILLNKTDVAVSGSLALGIFENKEIDLFRKSLKSGMTFVDVGSNIGPYTIIAAKIVGPTGKVFSFEPENDAFSWLKKNIEHNQFKNVIPLKIALDNTSGSRTLYLDKDNKGHNSFGNDKPSNEIQKVITETLDQSLKRYGSPRVDIIKMDIEGAEPLALEGMKETLSKNPNIIIFTEIFPSAMKKLGKDPLNFLKTLFSLKKSIWVIDENKTGLRLINEMNFKEFLRDLEEKEDFANLLISN